MKAANKALFRYAKKRQVSLVVKHIKDFHLEIIHTVPSQAWVAFGGVLVGSIFTLIGAWVTNRANNQRLQIKFKYENKIRQEIILREKLEDLYLVSHKYFNTLLSHQLPYRQVMEGELTFNQALDLVIELGAKKDFEPQRVTMLIHMYFPELKNDYNKILKIRDNLAAITNGYKEQYKTGNIDGSQWLDLFQPEIELLAEKTTQFEEKLTQLKFSA